MNQQRKNAKRMATKVAAGTLAATLTFGNMAAVATPVYAAESVEVEASVVEETVVAPVAVIDTTVVSEDTLEIINENLEKAEDLVAEGEAKVEEELVDFGNDVNATGTAKDNAEKAEDTAEDEAQNAADALEQAGQATNSAQAKEDAADAKDAADEAQNAADTALTEAEAAKKAYEEAKAAYEAALKEAEKAEAEANAAIDEAAKDEAAKVEAAEQATAKAEAKKDEMEAARVEAEKVLSDKEMALTDVKAELAAKEEALKQAQANVDTKKDGVEEALKATVETGAFLVAAEAYEAASELTVEALETTIEAMEAAKELATEALEAAEAKLNEIEGDKEEAQAAYDAAKKAYDEANASLESAKADLEAARVEKEEANELAGSNYGQTIMGIEKEIKDAQEAGDTDTVGTKKEELIQLVIKNKCSTEDNKIETVAKEGNYYVTTSESGTHYYKVEANEDGSFAVYEYTKTTTTTNIIGTETVDALPTDKNAWEYTYTQLENGKYVVNYLDCTANTVVDAEGKAVVFDTEEAAKEELAKYDNGEVVAVNTTEERTVTLKDLGSSVEDLFAGKVTGTNVYINGEAVTVSTKTWKETKKGLFGPYTVTHTDYYYVDAEGNETKTSLLEMGYYVAKGTLVLTQNVTVTTYTVTGVNYNETENSIYTLTDDVEDGNYTNVTNRVENADANYKTAEAVKGEKETLFGEATVVEKETADKLADAEEKYNDAEKIYSAAEDLYNSYYGNDTETLYYFNLKTMKWEEYDVEIPGTSQYAEHVYTLEGVKLFAEANLAEARKEVEAKKAAHSEAVDNLATATDELEKAAAKLAEAAIELGEAKFELAGATIDLTVAGAKYEQAVKAETEAIEAAEKAAQAEADAKAAQKKVDELKNTANVSREELKKALEALEKAEANAKAAQAAADNAQEKADEAKTAYEDSLEIVNKLVAEEIARAEALRDYLASLEQEEETTIEDEETPLTGGFTTIATADAVSGTLNDGKFYDANGKVIENAIVKADGTLYAVGEEGSLVRMGFVIAEDTYTMYFADKNGVLVTRGFIVEDGDSYLIIPKAKVGKNGVGVEEHVTYYAGKAGNIIVDKRVTIGDFKYTFDEDGVITKKAKVN